MGGSPVDQVNYANRQIGKLDTFLKVKLDEYTEKREKLIAFKDEKEAKGGKVPKEILEGIEALDGLIKETKEALEA